MAVVALLLKPLPLPPPLLSPLFAIADPDADADTAPAGKVFVDVAREVVPPFVMVLTMVVVRSDV